MAGAVYLLLQSEQILGFRIEPDLSSENPTALYFVFILVSQLVGILLAPYR